MSNSLIQIFNIAYANMVDVIQSSKDYLKCIRAINHALDSLLSAKSYLDEIEKSSLSNLLIVAKSFQRKYQDKDKEEVQDLKNYLAILQDLVPSCPKPSKRS